MNRRILVTGCAGFIGFHLSQKLLQLNYEVIGFDNLNHFYDEGLKDARLAILQSIPGFVFLKGDIADQRSVESLFKNEKFDFIVHLAAQAGVRYSLENPSIYIQSNIVGFLNLLEAARNHDVSHLVYASSSSVYGANKKIPFSEEDRVDCPVSLYAATKKSNELMAYTYSHLYGVPSTGLRFFTVYGPWGRPDMALFKFCKAILSGEAIDVYNFGRMQRDFTYIDDVVEGIIRVMSKVPQKGPALAESINRSSVYNIGNNQPVELLRLIHVLEAKIQKKAVINMLPMQPGDVPTTYASIDELARAVDYHPSTSIEVGVGRFVDWYREHYRC